MAETIEDGLRWAASQLASAWRHSSLIDPKDEAKVYGIISTAKASIMGGWATIRLLEETREQTKLMSQQLQALQAQNALLSQQIQLMRQTATQQSTRTRTNTDMTTHTEEI